MECLGWKKKLVQWEESRPKPKPTKYAIFERISFRFTKVNVKILPNRRLHANSPSNMLTLCRWHHHCQQSQFTTVQTGRATVEGVVFQVFLQTTNRIGCELMWLCLCRLSSQQKPHLASPSCYLLSLVSNRVQTGQTAIWIAILDLPWGRSRHKFFLAWKT